MREQHCTGGMGDEDTSYKSLDVALISREELLKFRNVPKKVLDKLPHTKKLSASTTMSLETLPGEESVQEKMLRSEQVTQFILRNKTADS